MQAGLCSNIEPLFLNIIFLPLCTFAPSWVPFIKRKTIKHESLFLYPPPLYIGVCIDRTSKELIDFCFLIWFILMYQVLEALKEGGHPDWQDASWQDIAKRSQTDSSSIFGTLYSLRKVTLLFSLKCYLSISLHLMLQNICFSTLWHPSGLRGILCQKTSIAALKRACSVQSSLHQSLIPIRSKL